MSFETASCRPAGGALLRSGARPGDTLWVSGRLGDARLALEGLRAAVTLDAGASARVREAMELPEPRVALGLALRGIATSAIDLSDGLAGDLAHVLRRSGVGATVNADALPMSPDLAAQPTALQRLCTLAGGDDYELLFTASPHARDAVLRAAGEAGVEVTAIGRIEAAPGARFVDGRGAPVSGFAGFDHFAS